jgi:molecular chaperone GrpE (heat shock protein)
MWSELARLRLDMRAREAEVVKLREEFARQEQQAAGAARAAGHEAVAGLLRVLAPTLSQLATLRQMAEAGREVRASDALKLCAKLERALEEHGLERIGEVGLETMFDPALHQRMSGGDVRDGDRVRVRFVGYRFRGETPVKALVSRVGQETGNGKE